ncbi:O-methyltransferase [Paenibacillus azoreducens]|uniref:Methyltransferase domain-containing protein n=1 Tax=Paenibacillus azoreducens TaxID=116718 RepID=A0A919YGS7_9BACL|nr:class I SAM-dependent methyltransferase [Paenibacillus azoreducens]GIO50912.1 hypothetical protein J34TS1_56770 [Paenibacillus azoreducens]
MAEKYSSNSYIPNLVILCKKLAEENNFINSCTDHFGKLLCTLVGQITHGNILEIGTGYGVGTAWIISALSSEVDLYSIDISNEQIDNVRGVIDQSNVHFICDDWKAVLDKGPFKLVFVDVKSAKQEEAELLYNLIESRGLLLIDDLTPEEYWPDEWKGRPDPVRDYWLNHPKMFANEILLTQREACIIATKIE